MSDFSENENETYGATRTYHLASKTAQEEIDLRLYENIIQDTVHNVIPNVKVTVDKSSYTVYGINRGQAIQIGRRLAKHFINSAVLKAMFFISYPCDFFTESENND